MDEFLDCVYFWVVIQTTLGRGDLVPSIPVLVDTQSLVGFTLVSWPAVRTLLETERFWREGTDRRQREACGAGRGRAVGG